MSRPTDDDRIEALRRFLVGLARGDDANQLSAEIADLHVRHDTFPGEVFMELSADALDAAGAERESAVVRACAERSGTPLEIFVVDLAERRAIDIS